MEIEILMTGIGGQGIQLAAQALAFAAIREGREAMVFGTYGGMMRGMHSDSTVVLGDEPIRTPPTITAASVGLGMHHEFWAGVEKRLRIGAVAVINTSVFHNLPASEDRHILPIDASTIATERGYPQSATLVALGALAAATQIVDLEALMEGAAEALPTYRKRHTSDNAAALRVGWDLILAPVIDAWHASARSVTA